MRPSSVGSVRPPLFHERPLPAAALGLCAGVGLFSFPGGLHLPLLSALAALGLFLLWRGWRMSALFFFSAVCGLLRARLPALSIPAAAAARFSDLAQAVGNRIDLLFPDWPGVARGMLLGSRNADISSALSERLYAVGVGHLLAVSGLHVSVLTGALLLVWRRHALKLRYAVIAAFLVFYCLLTGGAPSVVRASVMLLVCVPAGLSLRRRDPLSSLALACCIVVLLDPAAPASVGFQLSFLAVLGILLLSPVLQAHLALFGRTLSGLLSASLSAALFTAPVMARAFAEISVFGLAANVLLLPLVPLFLVPAFAAALLSFPFPALARRLAALPRLALDAMMTLARAGGSTVLRVAAPGLAATLFFYAGLLFLSRYCLRSERRRALYGAVCLLLSVVFACLFPAG